MNQELPDLIARLIVLVFVCTSAACGQQPISDLTWQLDSNQSQAWSVLGGNASLRPGPDGKALALLGDSLLEMRQSADKLDSSKPFTLTIWFCPFSLEFGQQMIAAKNQYSLNKREWSLLIDRDRKLRLYLRQQGCLTAELPTDLEPGHWCQAAIVNRSNSTELWFNGRYVDAIQHRQPIEKTTAPLTFGGVNDAGSIRQCFMGALSSAHLYRRALSSDELQRQYSPYLKTLDIPAAAQPVELWDSGKQLPSADELSELPNTEFRVVKKWNQVKDGYTFLHGVALCWHHGKLFASFGHNKGAENTVSEEAQYRVSDDDGRNWSELRLIDAGEQANLAVSHGVMVSDQKKLWAFHVAYYNKMQDIHTRAYSFDEPSGTWMKHGVVIGNGFWPMNQPVKMKDGNWIMAGFIGAPYSHSKVCPAAVAISHGNDFTKWDLVKIQTMKSVKRMWGESSLFVSGEKVFNIARYGDKTAALLAISDDYGRTWQPSRVSNLPMATSKPAAGTLSTGQKYLVCTTASHNGGRRSPLTIAVSRVGEETFSKIFVVRRSRGPEGAGESAARLSLAYPYAVEHQGKLYVGYSNSGGRPGNQNSAELAIIPVKDLAVGL